MLAEISKCDEIRLPRVRGPPQLLQTIENRSELAKYLIIIIQKGGVRNGK